MPLVCFIVWAPYWCPDLWRRHFLWHSSDCCDPGERWHFFLNTVASPPKESVQFICLSKTGSKHVAWTRAHSSFTFASYMSRHRPMSPVLEPFSHKGATTVLCWCHRGAASRCHLTSTRSLLPYLLLLGRLSHVHFLVLQLRNFWIVLWQNYRVFKRGKDNNQIWGWVICKFCFRLKPKLNYYCQQKQQKLHRELTCRTIWIQLKMHCKTNSRWESGTGAV